MTALVEARDLRVAFGRDEVVHGVSFDVAPGECVALVGESGSGKSVTARSLVGMAGPGSRVSASRLVVDGGDALRFSERAWRRVRGSTVGLVLQDALVALDPLRTVGSEVAEAVRRHRTAPRGGVRARTLELLTDVGLPEPERQARQRPDELSGGLRQRALIASAIAGRPALLIADEPTTALDVTVQAQVLDLLDGLRAAGTALLLISHDLAVVARMADRVHVMRDGRFVEEGTCAEVLGRPGHPYTRELLAAVPGAHTKGRRLSAASGDERVVLRSPARPRPADEVAGPRHPADEDTGPRQPADEDTDPRQPADEEPGRLRRVDGGPSPSRAADEVPVLEAEGLTRAFGGRTVVEEVSFRLHRGETLGLVGESGSGKTTVARMVMGLLAPDAGEVRLDGGPWSALPERDRRPRRREIQLVHQDPYGSFDPRFTVRRLLDEALRGTGRDRAELLDQVRLPAVLLDRRPRELSGGQRQRLAIARALASRPRVLVCDEPVSALDVSVQARILDLLADLQAELGMAYLFVSHHIGVVRHVSDRVMVMRAGRVVETGPSDRVLDAPEHPYTRRLLAAVPSLAPAPARTPPNPLPGDTSAPADGANTPASGANTPASGANTSASGDEAPPAERPVAR